MSFSRGRVEYGDLARAVIWVSHRNAAGTRNLVVTLTG